MKREEIIRQIDSAANELVYRKTSLIKAYNYYNCKRDPEQFRHLEENYGLGTPTQIEFTPLARKHIDALVGEYTSIPTKPKISCKDEKTLSNIMRDQQLKINKEVYNFYKSKLNNAILKGFQSNEEIKEDPNIAKELNNLITDLNENYISDYEIAAHNILEDVMQEREIDYETKKAMLARDLYITGTAYYRARPTENYTHLNFEVLNPLNTFIDRNPNSLYLKDSYRAVVRYYMSKLEILNKYGDIMDDKAIEAVKNIDFGAPETTNTYYVRSSELLSGDGIGNGIVAGLEAMPGIPTEKDGAERLNRLIEVLDVEWLDVEEENGKFVMYRYEGIRINGYIYIPIGKVEKISRSVTAPTKAHLSVNGIFFSDRNGEPFSLILATANLQDKFDILHFYRDNVFSSSGVKGDWLDISMLPTFLGKDITERIIKFQAYKKQLGVGIIDTSQEGRAFNNNTTFAGYDDSLRADVVQAFDVAINSIENTCSSITGVGRERLGGIEQKDAVTNVAVGVRMSAIITRQYFQTLDTIIKEILTDCLNLAKIVYKDGKKGVLLLGDKLQKVFTALPEYYTLTDFDIHVNDSSELVKDVETIKLFTQELIKANIIDANTAVNALDSKSLTELKRNVSNGIKTQDAKMGQAQQLQQQLQQAQQQLQELQKQLQEANNRVEQAEGKLNNAATQSEESKLELEWFKARNDKNLKGDELNIKKEQVQAEVMQLYDDNNKNNEIKNI